MKPAAPRHRWKVGDRFRFNRWALREGTVIEGAIFTIVAMRPKTMYFRSAYDQPTDRDRRMSREQFRRDVRQRLLVREP